MPNNTSPAWLDITLPLVKGFESRRLNAYQDSVGVWTIGYGATGPGIVRGAVWTCEKAEADLSARLAKLGSQVGACVTRTLTDNQKAALVSFAYNVGINALRSSTLLKKLNTGDFDGAADEFLRWNKAGGKVLAGLTNRRAQERKVFLA